jgi:hypothetical protein
MAYRTQIPSTAPLIAHLVPVRSPVLRSALQVALGVAFLAVLAQLRFQLGPVPVTGQTLGVLLIGAGFGASLGLATLLAYLAAGGLGLAVFSGGAAGWEVLARPAATCWAFRWPRCWSARWPAAAGTVAPGARPQRWRSATC